MKKIVLVDDIDGTVHDDTKTYSFALDGISYEIDLSPRNAEKFLKAFAPYTEKGTRARVSAAGASVAASVRKPKLNSETAAAHKERLAKIREWALASGFHVSERGRISADIQAAYDAAQAGAGTDKPAAESTEPVEPVEKPEPVAFSSKEKATA